jgi:hypothetical protein
MVDVIGAAEVFCEAWRRVHRRVFDSNAEPVHPTKPAASSVPAKKLRKPSHAALKRRATHGMVRVANHGWW